MTDFQHQHSAHCESGVVSALLQHHGIAFNEAMVFGLASALSFAYIPLVKLNGQPLIAYRTPPKSIIRRVCRALGIELALHTFRNEQAGMAALDQVLGEGKVVGLQTSVFWLPYFPAAMRFHFNAHNLLVYGKEGDEYLISDPVFETVQRCAAADLQRARFAKGALAAKGLMYTIERAPDADEVAKQLPSLLRQAVAKTAKHMQAPLFFVGTRGIHTLANKIAALPFVPEKLSANALYLGHIVRMQEEIGTGGAGFRYIFAYFLQQAADVCQSDSLRHAADGLTAIGDEWRMFAAQAVRQCRKPKTDGYQTVAAQLHAIAEQEAALWHRLAQWAKERA